jgi:zinc transport system substrate-binding protein
MKILKKSALVISLIAIFSFTNTAYAQIKVVTSIKPLHSLVSNVMDGVGKPGLIVTGNASPHTFQFKPESAKMIQEADIVFWIGKDLETFLEKPIKTIGQKAKVVNFLESKEIKKFKYREDNVFKEAGHDDQGDKKRSKKKDKHDHDAHGEFDAHIWTDPENAKIMVEIITKQLSELDVKNKSLYENNRKKTLAELDSLIKDISKDTNKKASFIVFHDAYQYFEKRFEVKTAGALSINPEVLPGAKQLASIREEIKTKKINCVFSEPQFNPSISKAIAQDTGIKTFVMDPLGADLNDGKDLYFKLIRNISASINKC